MTGKRKVKIDLRNFVWQFFYKRHLLQADMYGNSK